MAFIVRANADPAAKLPEPSRAADAPVVASGEVNSRAVAHVPDRRRVNVVTYMNEVNPLFGYLQVSAAAHGLHPRVLGYGEEAWWPEGLGAKINALRTFVHTEVTDEELVIFLDAFDVMVFGSSEEIALRFEALESEHNRSVFFNCEQACFPNFEDICTEDYPQTPFPQFKYLNSGIFIGRGGALKRMLKDPVDVVMPGGDQAWYQRYYLHFPDRVGVDSQCALLCALQGDGPTWGLTLQGGRFFNTITRTSPSLVHFVGPAHWPKWRGGVPTTLINDVFKKLYPEAGERLFSVIDLSMRVDGSHRSSLMKLKGSSKDIYFSAMRLDLCFKCRLLGNTDRECEYVPDLGCDMCAEVRAVAALLVALAVALLLCVRGLPVRLRRSPDAPPGGKVTAVSTQGVHRSLAKVTDMIFTKSEKAV